MKFLIIEDEDEIRELIKFNIEIEGNCTVVEARDGLDAMEILKKTKDFDVIICDYQMPGATGGDVLKFIHENNIKTKFVLSSAYEANALADIDEKDLFFSIKKPDISEGIDKIFGMFKESIQDIEMQRDYIPISLNLVYQTGVCPADIFIEINKDKALKILKAGEIFSAEDLEKYNWKGLKSLLIQRSDAKTCLEKIQNNIKILYSKTELENIDKTVDVQEFVHQIAQNLGLSKEVLEIAGEGITFAINIIKKNDSLRKALKNIFKSEKDYVPQHSVAMAYITCGIASKMQWNSELTMVKLAFASLIHDVAVPNAKLNEKDVIDGGNLDEKFLSHPIECVRMLYNLSDIPPDVDRIILEHHEQPDGTGFPKKLESLQISPLSTIFIIAHEIADFVMLMTKKNYKITNMLVTDFLHSDKYNKSNFKKVVKAVEESNLFN